MRTTHSSLTPAPVLTFCQRSIVADRARPLRSACADTCAICAPGELSGWHTERVLSHREIQSRWKTRSQQPGRTVHGSVGGDHAASAGRSSATPANVALGREARSVQDAWLQAAWLQAVGCNRGNRSTDQRRGVPFAHVCLLRARFADVSLPAGSGDGVCVPVPVLNIKSGRKKPVALAILCFSFYPFSLFPPRRAQIAKV